MKILHIIDSLSSGGAEKLLCDISLEMIKNESITVDILLLTDKDNVYHEKLDKHNISIEVVPIKKIKSPLNILYIRNYINLNKYDIVHAHLFPANYWTSLASRMPIRNKPKFLTTEHSTFNRRRSISWLKYVEKIIYNNFDLIFSISEETQNNLLSWVKPTVKSRYKYLVVKNGINVEDYRDAQKYDKRDLASSISDCDTLLCMVGRFTDSKDHETLIDAMRKIPDYVSLILVGEGPKLELVRMKVHEFNLSNRVAFLGFRNDVNRIIKTVDIVILSSNWEGFGLAAVEGMAAGKPVVASDVKGLRDIVDGAGMLFEKGNSIALSNAIIRLLENKTEYHRISNACKARASEYSINNTTRQYLHLYKKILR